MSFSKAAFSVLVATTLGMGVSACDKGGPDRLAGNKPSIAPGSQLSQGASGPGGMQQGTQKDDKLDRLAADTAITAKVKTELLKEPSLKSSQINVETVDGVVKLDGFVNSRHDADRAGEIAGNTGEVRSVENKLQVKPSNG